MTDETTQLDREHLKAMTPDQIVDALDSGRLDQLLGRPARREVPTFPSRADLAWMTNDEILAAKEQGRLNHLLEGRTIGETR